MNNKSTKLYNVELDDRYNVMFTFDYGKRHKVVSLADLELMATFYERMYNAHVTNKALDMFHEMYPDAKDGDEHHLEFTKLRVKVAMRGAK
jgi:hypothetical protein